MISEKPPGAIVLAAGGATRMGGGKQLLTYRGKTLLRRAAEAAVDAGCEPVVVVLGCAASSMTGELAGLAVTIVENPDWERGIGTSIRAGVRRLSELDAASPAAVIHLCDQPLIDGPAIRRLIEARRASGKAVCVSSFDDNIGPPVLVGREFFGQLLNLPDGPGAKAIWSQNPLLVCEVPSAQAAADVDTPEDYCRLKLSEPCEL